jgi:hypothetical protein
MIKRRALEGEYALHVHVYVHMWRHAHSRTSNAVRVYFCLKVSYSCVAADISSVSVVYLCMHVFIYRCMYFCFVSVANIFHYTYSKHTYARAYCYCGSTFKDTSSAVEAAMKNEVNLYCIQRTLYMHTK